MAVYKRGSVWYYDFMIRRKRYRGAIPEARTKAQAERVETQKREEVYAGRYGRPGETVTLKQYILETYLPWSKAHKRSWREDELKLTKAIIPFFKETRLADVNQIQIEKFKRERMATPARRGRSATYVPRATSTVNHELKTLSGVLSLACKQGLLSSNPCKTVKKLAGDSGRTTVCSPEDEKLLRENMPPQLVAVFDVAIHTGCRLGELVNLNWDSVDFEREEFTVTSYKSGSGAAKPRTLPMNGTVRAILAGLKNDRGEGREFVFANRYGERYIRPNCTFMAIRNRLAVSLGRPHLRNLRWHDLRHTAASRMADRGADPFTLAEILGHSDLRNTKRYTHATQQARRRAVVSIEGYGQEASPVAARGSAAQGDAAAAAEDCRKIVSIEERRKTG